MRDRPSENVQRASVVHTSILAPPQDVVAFVSDMENWKRWAPWVQSVARSSSREWTLETPTGGMKVRFVEPNSHGVLDHHVTLESGMTVFNAMRVVPNGIGSELVMVVFQAATISNEEFERDIQAVTDDLARLKSAVEAISTGQGR